VLQEGAIALPRASQKIHLRDNIKLITHTLNISYGTSDRDIYSDANGNLLSELLFKSEYDQKSGGTSPLTTTTVTYTGAKGAAVFLSALEMMRIRKLNNKL
jgi:hypothetical protein